VQLESEVVKLRQELERERHHANIDALTGIPNRRAYQIHLRLGSARCRRENKPLSLIVLDIDNFKSINARYGHWMGDQILICIAGKIRHRLRKTDFVARYRGEEFVSLAGRFVPLQRKKSSRTNPPGSRKLRYRDRTAQC